MAMAKRQINKFRDAAREVETDDNEKTLQSEAGQDCQAEAGCVVENPEAGQKRA